MYVRTNLTSPQDQVIAGFEEKKTSLEEDRRKKTMRVLALIWALGAE